MNHLLSNRIRELTGRQESDLLALPISARQRTATPPQNGLILHENTNMLLHLRADESVRDGLVRVSSRIIQNALVCIAQPCRNRAEDLHQVRLTFKRLRALLRLVQPVIGKGYFKQENRRLKRIADRLARFRDTTVSYQTLAALAAHLPLKRDQKAFIQVLERLVENGPEPRRFKEDRETEMAAAGDELREAGHSFQDTLVIPVDEWEAIEPGLRRTYRRARYQMLLANRRDTEKSFHQWRKQVKYFYYQLQMLQPAWSRRLTPMVRQLKKLEDKLGRDHDLAVLEKSLMKLPRRYVGRRAVKRVVACLNQQRAKLRRQSEALGRDVFVGKPDRLLGKMHKRWTAWRAPGL
jgi:CHAD domain-containing protein